MKRILPQESSEVTGFAETQKFCLFHWKQPFCHIVSLLSPNLVAMIRNNDKIKSFDIQEQLNERKHYRPELDGSGCCVRWKLADGVRIESEQRSNKESHEINLRHFGKRH
ncbi:MAG: hypothetical protein AB7P14_05620 [Blastocatellales bacterium]